MEAKTPELKTDWHGEGSCWYCGEQWLHEWSECAKTPFSEESDAVLPPGWGEPNA